MRPLLSLSGAPEYHEGMLLVRTRPAALPAAYGAGLASNAFGATFATAESLALSPPSVGFAALGFYERAGLIKRVVPVERADASAPDGSPISISAARSGFGATAAVMAGAARAFEAANPSQAAGLSLIELEREEDRERVQVALANDPTFATVSRVPVRYFTARRARSARASSGNQAVGIAASPPSPTTMWNLRKIQWEQARQLSGFVDASAIDVAVLDTGIDTGHPDLQGRIAGYVYEHPDLPSASSSEDIIGHGTHVSGTIAALINNGLGINGICECKIHSWKIFDDIPDLFRTSYVYFVDPVMYLRALFDCIDARPGVVNLSIGGPGKPSDPELQAFQQIIANGTVVVAAMGNGREQGSEISFPAAIPGVVAVGATGLADRFANFSNRGNHITLCAPGEAIWSTLPTYPGQLGFDAVIGPDGRPRQGSPQRRETDYDAWPGTSMATPHVTAAVALYLANGGASSPASVRRALIDSCDKVAGLGGANFNSDYGYGRLNLLTLLQLAQGNGGAAGAVPTA